LPFQTTFTSVWAATIVARHAPPSSLAAAVGGAALGGEGDEEDVGAEEVGLGLGLGLGAGLATGVAAAWA